MKIWNGVRQNKILMPVLAFEDVPLNKAKKLNAIIRAKSFIQLGMRQEKWEFQLPEYHIVAKEKEKPFVECHFPIFELTNRPERIRGGGQNTDLGDTKR